MIGRAEGPQSGWFCGSSALSVDEVAARRSNQFRSLEGGDAFEPVDENPMIGYRGCFRYVREHDLFAHELELSITTTRRGSVNECGDLSR